MFKKKEAVVKPVNGIDGQYIRRPAGVLKVYPDVSSESSTQQPAPSMPLLDKSASILKSNNHMSASDISEQYLSAKSGVSMQANASVKGVRKKLVPFLTRKKKASLADSKSGLDVSFDELDDVAGYNDFTPEKHVVTHKVLGEVIGEHMDSEQSVSEEEYNSRMEYILNNYRHPPPYPGKKSQAVIDRLNKRTRSENLDTPMINHLLQENNKVLTDNVSMINYWQAGPGVSGEDVISDVLHHPCDQDGQFQGLVSTEPSDKLVMRTQNLLSAKGQIADATVNSGNSLSAGQLFKKRQEYYIDRFNTLPSPPLKFADGVHEASVYDERVHAVEECVSKEVNSASKSMGMSASAPDLRLAGSTMIQMPNQVPHTRKDSSRRVRMEPGELDALIAHYRKTSLDHFGHGHANESISLYSGEESPSYVPPSPYLSAEIPEWLQVYAKASSEMDCLLKWDMFRYHELDCWQTMLKRLYKKELEQIVLWFEEYRQSLQHELERRDVSLGLGLQGRSQNISDLIMQKTDV